MTTTTPTAEMAALLAKLPAQAALFRVTSRAEYFLHAAMSCGWTIEHLAAELGRNLDGVANAGGVITTRLEVCTTIDAPHFRSAKTKPKAHNGCCEGGWLYPDVHAVDVVTKCPGRSA